MTPGILALPFDELRTLHREIGALIAENRSGTLEQLKAQMLALGFTSEDVAGKKQRRKRRKHTEDERDDFQA